MQNWTRVDCLKFSSTERVNVKDLICRFYNPSKHAPEFVHPNWRKCGKYDKHPTDSVRPNGQFAVNCTGFGCTIKGYFVIIPEFYGVFFWEVLHTAINIMNHYHMKTKISKHEHNRQLSYPDHSWYDNVNFHCNL